MKCCWTIIGVMSAALMLLAAWSARASPVVYGSGASLPRVITMERLKHVACDRANQEEQVAFGKLRTHCNEETSVLNAAMAEANINIEALAAQTKKVQRTL